MQKQKTSSKFVQNIAEMNLPRPDQIKEYLDQYVIGQDDAKKTLSVAVYNHYKRIIYNTIHPNSNVTIEKSCPIILGPTGGGKTYMLKKIGELLRIPVVVVSTPSYTQAGYVGEDVEGCLTSALRACDYNLEVAQNSIIVLDEMDKIRKAEAGPSITRDVGGQGVQESLLKLVEGTIASVAPQGGRKHPEQAFIQFDTTNTLFVGLGAFVGLDEIVKRRFGKGQIGFSASSEKIDSDNYLKYVSPQDLKSFGFIPEFIGRFPIFAHVNKLTEEDLLRILKEPKNSLVKQYQELLSMDDVKLKFKNDALQKIANLASKLETGARALRTIVESVMEDVMFDAPRMASDGISEIVITEDMVESVSDKYKNIKIAA